MSYPGSLAIRDLESPYHGLKFARRLSPPAEIRLEMANGGWQMAEDVCWAAPCLQCRHDREQILEGKLCQTRAGKGDVTYPQKVPNEANSVSLQALVL